MAGTEETQETENADVAASPSSGDGVHSDLVGERGPIDGSVHTLTLSDLHSRVHTARTWRAQGMVKGEPLDIVRDACREFLEATEDEAAELSGTPYVPSKKPCADCHGVDMHKPTCLQLRR